MHRKSIKHEKLAIAGFVIALILAMVAFYYIYQNVQYGRSLEGLQRYACVQYLQQNPGESTCPEFVLIQPQNVACCCDTGGTSRFHIYQVYAQVGKDASDTEITQACSAKCTEGGPRATLVNVGRCSWIES